MTWLTVNTILVRQVDFAGKGSSSRLLQIYITTCASQSTDVLDLPKSGDCAKRRMGHQNDW
jgi:hypothetical protein